MSALFLLRAMNPTTDAWEANKQQKLVEVVAAVASLLLLHFPNQHLGIF